MSLAKEEVVDLLPMSLEEIANAMIETPQKFTTGFMATLNFYTQTKTLKLPIIPIQ